MKNIYHGLLYMLLGFSIVNITGCGGSDSSQGKHGAISAQVTSKNTHISHLGNLKLSILNTGSIAIEKVTAYFDDSNFKGLSNNCYKLASSQACEIMLQSEDKTADKNSKTNINLTIQGEDGHSIGYQIPVYLQWPDARLNVAKNDSDLEYSITSPSLIPFTISAIDIIQKDKALMLNLEHKENQMVLNESDCIGQTLLQGESCSYQQHLPATSGEYALEIHSSNFQQPVSKPFIVADPAPKQITTSLENVYLSQSHLSQKITINNLSNIAIDPLHISFQDPSLAIASGMSLDTSSCNRLSAHSSCVITVNASTTSNPRASTNIIISGATAYLKSFL